MGERMKQASEEIIKTPPIGHRESVSSRIFL